MLFIHSSVEWYFGFFKLLAIVDKTTVNGHRQLAAFYVNISFQVIWVNC